MIRKQTLGGWPVPDQAGEVLPSHTTELGPGPTSLPGPPRQEAIDTFGRPPAALPMSVIDKCDLRCQCCMPEEYNWLQKDRLLTFDEPSRIAAVFTGGA